MPRRCCRCAVISLQPIFVDLGSTTVHGVGDQDMIVAATLAVCLSLPTQLAVLDPFRAPDCARCAGNRGIEYAVPGDYAVRSGVTGEVVFVGRVATTHYVVIRAGAEPSVRVTYGGFAQTMVAEGDVVRAGRVLGEAGATLHVGVRVGEQYVDPRRLSMGALNGVTGAAPRFRVTLGHSVTRCGP